MPAARGSQLLRKPVRLACVQFASTPDKTSNLDMARRKVLAAARNGARIIVLPECFNSPYSTEAFPKYAEVFHPSPPSASASPTFHALSAMAQEADAYVVGGSIPELEPDTGKYYNTSLVFSPQGHLLGWHRKAHLFDVDFPGQMTFRESDVLSPGTSTTLIELEDYGYIGLGICFDIRFPELAAIAARKGAFALIYPSAFNTTTGPKHWELLGRARAVDNQVFVAMCSQSFSGSGYPAWGHSMIVDPSGQVMSTIGREEGIVYAELDDARIQYCRHWIPMETQRRFDLYPDVSKFTSGQD
ncbi:nitrilase family protein [Ilyonectria sp. MPI-CAGE-AT-0026]|nr:nitrilase family protein [Ilyonectria sp. MPI-CAGE-AT-0026]